MSSGEAGTAAAINSSGTYTPVVMPKLNDEAYGARSDRRDMVRMGKRQELRRNFQFFSIWGYSVILGCTWEWGLASGVFSLTNGGTAGAIWMFLAVCFGMTSVMLSMAEMASSKNVSEFSPRKYQRIFSYITGWFALLGWQTSLVGTAYVAGQQFEAMIALSNLDYVIKGWQGCLFTIGLTGISIVFNTVLYRHLPMIEGIIIVLHIFGFLAVVVNNGWSSVSLSCLVGILSPIITLVGADSSAHLSEELNNAAFVLPRAMTIMFTMGTDVDEVLSSRFGVPWVQILYNATSSYIATMTLTCVVGVLITCCLINNVTTSSRQLLSFARDGGVPFSSFFAEVRSGWDVPVNAMALTLAITIILSLFIIGSPVAFSLLTSLSLTGLISFYLLAVTCVLFKRIRGEPFPPGRFDLGRFGFVCNSIAVAFLLIAFGESNSTYIADLFLFEGSDVMVGFGVRRAECRRLKFEVPDQHGTEPHRLVVDRIAADVPSIGRTYGTLHLAL
nr:putative amino-acid permease c15c4.04c [Quercus suber]